MSSATEGEPEPEEQDDDAGEESTWLKLRTPGSEFDEVGGMLDVFRRIYHVPASRISQHLPLGSCPAAVWC